MTFSVVIPAFNGEKYIEKTIQSALNQSRMPDEVIIYDDNSSDRTNQICKKYADKIKYVHNAKGPSGFVNGWNQAIKEAKSDYISILHQDDILFPTFIQEVENALRANPSIKHIFSICNNIDNEGQFITDIEKYTSKKYKKNHTIFSGPEYVEAYQREYPGIVHLHRCPGVLTHRSIFESGCVYNPQAGHIADDDFFYRVGQLTSVLGIMTPLAAYRIHNNSETGSIGDYKLVERLAKDYIFQIRQWKGSSFISGSQYNFFVMNAYKYSKRLLGYSIKTRDAKKLIKALSFYDTLDSEGLTNPHSHVKGFLSLLKNLNYFNK